MEVGPLQPSGRVIAGGRLLLACLFLIAVWADTSQPMQAHTATFALLGAYVVWSLTVTLLVWKDWWRDARLAAPAHVIDVAVFMIILYATQGYTSPYFTFFIFILLAAAIRWGWKETAITAGAIIAAYSAVGLLFGPSPVFEVEQFIVRTGHLLIISAILIWFGANQWMARPRLRPLEARAGQFGGDPFAAALQAGMAATAARRGVLVWREALDEEIRAVTVSGEGSQRADVDAPTLPEIPASLLFELRRDRALMRADASRWRFLRAADMLPAPLHDFVDDLEGLAVPISTGTIDGLAIFQDVRALSTDHLDFAPRLARDLAARLQDAALFAAVEERSMAKARVAVARDLHDSVVQFLAGLGFQLEALNRSPAARGALGKSLADLKLAVIEEQRHLRAFIRGLRTGGSISLRTLSRDCASLCQLLARQWDLDCTFASKAVSRSVPMRTQIDVQHLVREAVANAARHGGASRVAVSLGTEGEHLRLTIADNGRGFATEAGEEPVLPASLNGRVREAGGGLEVSRAAGETSIVIHLPLEAAA